MNSRPVVDSYIRTLFSESLAKSRLELENAKEDFEAGYEAGLASAETRLAFIERQLRALIELAEQNDEFYSISIARYTLEALK
jgi:hypothetical protein